MSHGDSQPERLRSLVALPAAAHLDRSACEAIADLYREYFQYIWRSLRRLGVQARSLDDAVQDVFLVAHMKLDAFEGRSTPKVWLFGIALRVAAEHRRKDGKLKLDPDACAAVAHVDKAVEMRQRVQLLDQMLACLSDEQREVFVMAEIEQFSAPEIAALLSVKLNTVYSRLRLARAQFERSLSRHAPKSPRGRP